MLARAAGLVLDEAGGDELAGEALEVGELQPVRLELALEVLPHVLHRVLPVEALEDVVLLAAEAVVAQADGVLHDVEDLALVALLGDLKVRPDAEADRLAPLGRVVEQFGVHPGGPS